MYVRLAFAVAAHLEPEILLIDEVLAVGDAEFQRKCLGRMGQVAREGRTVVFVSHNMAAVAQLCERGIVLDRGRVVCDRSIDAAIQHYQAMASPQAGYAIDRFPARTGSGRVRIKEVMVTNRDGQPWLCPGAEARIAMTLEADTAQVFRAVNLTIGIGINGVLGERLVTLLNKFDPEAHISSQALGRGTRVVCSIPRLLLCPGSYYLSFYIDINGDIADRIKDAAVIEVQSGDFYGTGVMPTLTQGPFVLEQRWRYFPPVTEAPSAQAAFAAPRRSSAAADGHRLDFGVGERTAQESS
jgi:lipopolysaccharide transport system ATP-binding protein